MNAPDYPGHVYKAVDIVVSRGMGVEILTRAPGGAGEVVILRVLSPQGARIGTVYAWQNGAVSGSVDGRFFYSMDDLATVLVGPPPLPDNVIPLRPRRGRT